MMPPGKLTIHSLERATGIVVEVTKIGPAVRQPMLYRFLHGLGVLEQLPWKWTDSERLEPLPWGRPNADKFMKAVLPEGFDGPWPQLPVVDAGLYPPIINIGEEERKSNLRYIMCRYLGQIVLLTPRSAYRALRGPRLLRTPDERLDEIFHTTSFAQFIRTTLDEPDQRAFSGLIPTGEEENYAKVDFSAIAKLGPPLPGVNMAPTVSLLKRVAPEVYRFQAIRVRDKLFTPRDGNGWELAKFFVLQGAQFHIVVLTHPRLHFPQDCVNAISKTMLPQGHILYKLLRPHVEFTLGLHEAVIHHRRSVLHNSQREIYTPFPVPTDEMHKMVALGLSGIEGNSAYPRFKFGNFLPGSHTGYGQYRQSWFDAVYGFVSEVVALVPPNDAFVIGWADEIAKWLPGFPSGSEIYSRDALARAVTNFICAVSIFHTADHHSYSLIPLNLLPWRLRVSPPDVEVPQTLKPNAYVKAEDFFRQQLCHFMFFKPVPIRTLDDVQYDFMDGQARLAEVKFKESMKVLDRRWKGTTFPSSSQIAASLQY